MFSKRFDEIRRNYRYYNLLSLFITYTLTNIFHCKKYNGTPIFDEYLHRELEFKIIMICGVKKNPSSLFDGL